MNTQKTPTPNADQAAAIAEILAVTTQPFSQTHVMALIGYAGTGKSFTVGHVRRELERLGLGMATIAPTNQAVKVLEDAGTEAATCHKALRLKPKKIRGELVFTQRPLREGEALPFDGCAGLVVDESSMLDENMVNLILAAAREACVRLVLFVGDDAQLPPVSGNGKVSPALTTAPSKILRLTVVERGRGKCDAPSLAQVVRDNIEANRLTIAKDLTERLEQGDLRGVHRISPREDMSHLPGHEKMRPATRVLLSALRDLEAQWMRAGDAGLNSAQQHAATPYAVAFRNKTVCDIIKDVRIELTGSDLPFVGEELVFTNPLIEGIGKDERIVYNTGDRIFAKHVSQPKRCIYSDLEYVLVSDGEIVNGGGQRMMMVPRDIAEWLDFVSECWNMRREIEKMEPMQRSSEDVQKLQQIKSAIEELAMMVDLRGVWATTAHKSQGSTYGICIVDWQDMLVASSARGPFASQQAKHEAQQLAEQTFNRMVYVGLTRASDFLVLIL